jgi:hypothetical protein
MYQAAIGSAPKRNRIEPTVLRSLFDFNVFSSFAIANMNAPKLVSRRQIIPSPSVTRNGTTASGPSKNQAKKAMPTKHPAISKMPAIMFEVELPISLSHNSLGVLEF